MTETGDTGSEALVTNVGTNKDAILNFKIPRGLQEIQGLKCDTGLMGHQVKKGKLDHRVKEENQDLQLLQ